ncbi:MAG: methyltransferase domain-containing protein [Planctomycetota bacterium]
MGRAWLTPELAERLLAAVREGRPALRVSLDLGLTETDVRLSAGSASLGDAGDLPTSDLAEIADATRGVFLVEDGPAEPIQIAADLFYKLIPTAGAPTIEISGIQMHRTTGTDPFENAVASARTVVRRDMRVLDTCGGLGYTAVAAVRLGAESVTSVEVDPRVWEVARRNPWSAEYFSDPKIERVRADAAEFVSEQRDGAYDAVIHDPPRFSRAGELYGGAFYAGLARVLRPGGRLFHYTGEPYGRRRSFVGGVIRRLREAGFRVRRVERLQGVVARR